MVHEFKQYNVVCLSETKNGEQEILCAETGDLIATLNTFCIACLSHKTDVRLEIRCVLKRRQREEQWLSKLENYVRCRYDLIRNGIKRVYPAFDLSADGFCKKLFIRTAYTTYISCDEKELKIVWYADKNYF